MANLARPVILIALLVASRRTESDARADVWGPTFDRWRLPLVSASVAALVASSLGFAVGTTTGQPVLSSSVGLLVSAPVFWRMVDAAHGGPTEPDAGASRS